MDAGSPHKTRTIQESRDLDFADLCEVMPEVERLYAVPHRCTGRWDLAQTCKHLADGFIGSMDGFGVHRHMLMRLLFGRSALRDVFKSNSLGSGFTVTEKLNPPPHVDPEKGIEVLASAIDRFRLHSAAYHFHPFFGHLTKSEWDRLHRIHCAHHLRRITSA